MVLPASDAFALTNTAITNIDATELQTEVSLAETKIRAATSFGLYSLAYDAKIIGNPAVDPRITESLTPNQLNFYNAFVQAAYVVGLDPATGYWSFSWDTQGAENLVAIYSFRTTFNPAEVLASTQSAITAFFNGLRPVVYVNIGYNGFIDESGFGGVSSTFYEFTIVANQGSDSTNYATPLKSVLVSQGLGFTSDNCNVYQLIS